MIERTQHIEHVNKIGGRYTREAKVKITVKCTFYHSHKSVKPNTKVLAHVKEEVEATIRIVFGFGFIDLFIKLVFIVFLWCECVSACVLLSFYSPFFYIKKASLLSSFAYT